VIPPEISRRLARVFNNIPFHQRHDILTEIEKAETWDDLPSWIRDLVIKIEGDSL